MTKNILALSLAAVLAGCAVTQPIPPKLDLPTATATDEQNALLERWWVAFEDPVLTALIDEALANNLDLQAAVSRIDAARSLLLLSQSSLYPSVVGRAGATRVRPSQDSGLTGGLPTIGVGNDLNVGIDMSYELDVWGKYRSGALAASNDVAAASYDLQAVRITVAADIASAYFRLRAADALLVILEDTEKSRADTVRLQKDRFEGGIIGEYDLRQAEAELAAILADIARARQAIAITESAIATLAGRSPRQVFGPQVARGESIEAATRVPQLPSGLPSGLVDRRPDIRRIESQLAAADLRIQQARAAYFPDLTLTGSYGFESTTLANLFTAPAQAWRFGFGLLQPLFNLKSIEAGVQGAEARHTTLLVQYQQTVQNAFREVHDALVVNRSSAQVLAAESNRRALLRDALEVANLRYDAGRTSYLEVLDAQRTLLASETLRIAAARDARLSIVDFAKSLGGGWHPEIYAVVY